MEPLIDINLVKHNLNTYLLDCIRKSLNTLTNIVEISQKWLHERGYYSLVVTEVMVTNDLQSNYIIDVTIKDTNIGYFVREAGHPHRTFIPMRKVECEISLPKWNPQPPNEKWGNIWA